MDTVREGISKGIPMVVPDMHTDKGFRSDEPEIADLVRAFGFEGDEASRTPLYF